MESQNKEKEYEHNVWEIYRKEWATASPEKRIALNKRMRRWQELMNSGLPAQQAYYKAMEEELAFTVAEEPSGKQVAIPSAPRLRKAPLIFLSLALVASIVYSVVTTMDRNTLNTELESVQSALTSTEVELTSTRGALSSVRTEFDSTKQTLTSTQGELEDAEAELTSTQGELEDAEAELTSTQSELSSTKQTLTSTQGELEDAEAELRLYKETLGIYVFSSIQPPPRGGGLSPVINLTNNPTATNPSWQQLISFLLTDPTDDKLYRKNIFVCSDFAQMLHNNAEAAGIKAAFVGIDFRGGGKGHALNAFKTTDRGLVYVDCQGRNIGSFTFGDVEYDKIAYVKKGKEYGLVSIDMAFISPKYSFYEQIGKSSGSGWVPLGIVERIEIYW